MDSLLGAKSVIIVPGYCMAVAKAHFPIKDIVGQLKGNQQAGAGVAGSLQADAQA